jgi:hypothetical protein
MIEWPVFFSYLEIWCLFWKNRYYSDVDMWNVVSIYWELNSVAWVRERIIPTNRPSDRRLSAKLIPTFADIRCSVVGVTDFYGRILVFLDRSHYFFFQVAPQLYSRGWGNTVPDPLFLRKSGSAGNRTWDLWICSQELRLLGHRGGRYLLAIICLSGLLRI